MSRKKLRFLSTFSNAKNYEQPRKRVITRGFHEVRYVCWSERYLSYKCEVDYPLNRSFRDQHNTKAAAPLVQTSSRRVDRITHVLCELTC